MTTPNTSAAAGHPSAGPTTGRSPGGKNRPTDTEVVQSIRGSSLLLVGRLGAMVVALITQALVVRVVDKVDYGVFAFGLTLVSAFRVLVSFGDSQSVGRFLTLEAEKHDRRGFTAMLAVIVLRIVLVSIVVLGAVIIGADRLTASFLSETSDQFVIVVLVALAPLEALGGALGAVFAVFGNVRMVLLRKYLYAPLVRLLVVTVLALGGFGIRALAIGYVLGELVGFGLYILVVRRSIEEMGRRGSDTALGGSSVPEQSFLSAARVRVGPYLRFALPAGTVEMVSILMTTVTVMMLGWWHGPEAVADFRSVFPFGRLNQMALLTFSVLFAPLATRLFVRSDRPGMELAYWQTSTYLAVLSFPGFLLSVPLAWQTVPLVFGERYASAAPVLAVLGGAYFLHTICGYNALVLQIHGRIRWVLAGNMAAMSASLLAGFLIIPRLGAVGVSWSVLAGLLTQNVINQTGLHRLLGFGWLHPIIGRTLLASVVLTMPIAAMAALGAPFAASVVAAAVASVILLVLTRRSLALAEVFPALANVPLLGRLVR